jgi:hypothetical protein
VANGIGDQIPRLRQTYDEISAELREIDALAVELDKLRTQKSAEKLEAGSTLNRLIAMKSDLDQV